MGVDFVGCDYCGYTFCDSGKTLRCPNDYVCGKVFCGDCDAKSDIRWGNNFYCSMCHPVLSKSLRDVNKCAKNWWWSNMDTTERAAIMANYVANVEATTAVMCAVCKNADGGSRDEHGCCDKCVAVGKKRKWEGSDSDDD
jgi:hypothetical protein